MPKRWFQENPLVSPRRTVLSEDAVAEERREDASPLAEVELCL